MTDFIAENRAPRAELTEIHAQPSRYYDIEAFGHAVVGAAGRVGDRVTATGHPHAPLYDDVVVPVCRTCRTCHIARPGGDRTDVGQMTPDRISRRVCGAISMARAFAFTMPHADVSPTAGSGSATSTTSWSASCRSAAVPTASCRGGGRSLAAAAGRFGGRRQSRSMLILFM